MMHLCEEHGRLTAADRQLAGVCNTRGETGPSHHRQSFAQAERSVWTEAFPARRIWHSCGGPLKEVLPAGRNKG